MRKKIIAGNWKMNKTVEEALELAQELKRTFRRNSGGCGFVPTIYSYSRVEGFAFRNPTSLVHKICLPRMKAAYTGEISHHMLKEFMCVMSF